MAIRARHVRGVASAIACLGLLSGGVAGATDTHAAGTSRPSRGVALEGMLKELVRRSGAPGGVLLVQTPEGTWRGATGVARKSPRVPMRATARFRVASVTKAFTATLVLGLVADGVVSLDHPVERWLPGRLPTKTGAEVTVRDLLGHRSGLTDAGTIEPRGVFRYADGNYVLLGEIADAATPFTYARLLSRRILEPLRLARTEVRPSPPPADIVHGYLANGGRDVTSTLLTKTAAPAAGLVSTADDLARFERALFGRRLIPRKLVKAMQTPVSVFEPGYAYGLGLSTSPSTCGAAWGHAGRMFGYTAWMLWTPTGKRTAVALLNTGVPVDDRALWRRLERVVTRALCA